MHLVPEGDLEEGEEKEPEEAVNVIEDKQLGDEVTLVRLRRAMVFKVGQGRRELVEDDKVEKLEADPPRRRIEQVECQRSDGVAPVGRLDPDVAGVQQANEGGDEQRLGRKHGDGDAMLEVAAPLRVVQLRKAKGVEARRGEAR